jgi:predicted small metal-binding protein
MRRGPQAKGGPGTLRFNADDRYRHPPVETVPSFKCKDIGMACGFETSAPNEAELEKKIAEHARSVHNIKSLDKEMLMKIKQQIR